MISSRYYVLFPLLALGLGACDDDGLVEAPTGDTAVQDAILDNVGENVILATYADLDGATVELRSATQALEATPSEEALVAARAAWVAARSPWEQSEGFLFGPVDQEGLDPALDSWPVNVTDLDNVLASDDELTVDYLRQQEGTLKGFHTVEFLLWGADGTKTVEGFSDREFAYLAASAGALAADAAALHDLWRPGGGDFIANVTEAGEGSVVYRTPKSALQELASAIVAIGDEVANGKINAPFAEQDLSLEESRFSANSKSDFADNIRSIRNIYTGTYAGAGGGQGLSVVVAAQDAGLDARVRAEIEAAIQAIETIPGTFSTAVFEEPEAVRAAQDAVLLLKATLESEVEPLVSDL